MISSNNVYNQDFSGDSLELQGWSYYRPEAASISSGALTLYADQTDNGARATWTSEAPILNFSFSASRYYHPDDTGSGYNYFGRTNFNLIDSTGGTISIQTSPLLSDYGPDYQNDAANYGRPRLIVYGQDIFDVAFADITSASLHDRWLTSNLSLDSSTGSLQIDLDGDNVNDFTYTNPRLVGAALVNIDFEGYGWFTGHSASIDDIVINGDIGTAPPQWKSDQMLNAAFDRSLIAVNLATAAYVLRDFENTADGLNTIRPVAYDLVKDEMVNYITFLDQSDLGTAAISGLSVDTTFGSYGLIDGVYTNENAAALVGRTDTTLYIAFRGTNGAQDYDDWVQLSPFDRSRSDHYDLFLPLFDALTTYLQSHSEITKISLAGHSLGASMAQYLYTSGFFQNIAIEDTIFSNPGYEIDLRPDNVNGRAILDFLLDGDVIEPARNFLSSEVKGDLNRVHWVGVGDSLSAIEIHTVLNYQKVMQFLWAESLIDYNFSTSVFWNVAYGGRGFNDLTVGVVTSQVNDVAQFISIGTADDILVGSKIYSELFSSYTYFSDVIIGGSGNDRLYGEGGGDLLYGGTDSDSLYGGSGADSLFGGIGQDFLQGGAGIDVLDGGGENDDLRGEVASDTVFGKDGDDSLFGGRGADSLYGGSGLDDLRGEDGMDYMDGGDDADTLYGGKNSDTMFGGAGDDTIMGQSGVDILFGGDGSDLFRFYVASDSSVAAGVDEIRDFAAGGGIVIGPSILASGPSDIIDLSAIDAITRTKLINDSFHFDGQHPDPTILGIGSSGIVGNVWYEQRGGFTWVLANIQGDGTPELTIKLAGTIDLTIDNFIL